LADLGEIWYIYQINVDEKILISLKLIQWREYVIKGANEITPYFVCVRFGYEFGTEDVHKQLSRNFEFYVTLPSKTTLS
jgi:hypothetical protein